jgi:hypothetical protein
VTCVEGLKYTGTEPKRHRQRFVVFVCSSEMHRVLVAYLPPVYTFYLMCSRYSGFRDAMQTGVGVSTPVRPLELKRLHSLRRHSDTCSLRNDLRGPVHRHLYILLSFFPSSNLYIHIVSSLSDTSLVHPDSIVPPACSIGTQSTFSRSIPAVQCKRLAAADDQATVRYARARPGDTGPGVLRVSRYQPTHADGQSNTATKQAGRKMGTQSSRHIWRSRKER